MSTGSEAEIEEDLRLAYVAMTRARDHLYVTWPQRYYHRWRRDGDSHSYPQLSRFFTTRVRKTIEKVSLEQEKDPDGASPIAGR